MASGPTRFSICAKARNGTCCAGLLKSLLTPLDDWAAFGCQRIRFGKIEAVERFGGVAVFRNNFKNDFVLVGLRVDRADLSLPESVIEVGVDRRRR